MSAPLHRLERQLTEALTAHLSGKNPAPPEAGVMLWNAFMQLSRSRTYHGAGPNPIAWGEIEAWARLMRMPLEPRHVEIIAAMDDAWLAHAYAKPASGNVLPPVSKVGLTPALFDAVVDRR